MAINKNKVQLQETVLDSNGHPLSSTDVNPLTSSDCVYMENGMTLEDVMGNDTISTPTIMNEDTSFKVGVGDSEAKVIDSDVAKMVIEGKTYQNILPKPTTLIMNTDEKEFKINDKIDNNIVLDDNVAEIATVKGQTYVNVVQEESASEYVAIDEELNGQSITTNGKPEGMVKNATLEGLTLVNTIQEPSEANSVVLDLDADINAQSATINNTVQGGIKSAILKGQTLVNIFKSFANYSYSASERGVEWLIKGSAPSTETLNNDELTMTLTGVGSKVVRMDNVSMLKPNTKYMVKVNYTTSFGWEIYFGWLDNSIIYTQIATMKSNEYAIFTTPSDLSTWRGLWFGILGDLQIGDTIKISKPVLIEYQDGMENWDIPYFEGMQSVQMPVLTTIGKNLFDGELLDGLFIENISRIGGDGTIYKSIKIKLTKGTYTLSFDNPVLIVREIKDGIYEQKLVTRSSYTFTVDTDGYYGISFREAGESRPWTNTQGMIEKGTTATTYEPHKSNILTVNEEVELRGIGEVQDTLDLLTGEVTERIGEIVLDGSQQELSVDISRDNTVLIIFNSIKTGLSTGSVCICDKLPFKANSSEDFEHMRMNVNGNVCFWINKTKFEELNVAGVKKYLLQNPITVQYPLVTESIKTVDLSIQDQDNNSLKSIQTHPTLTHVSTSSNGLIPFLTIPSQLKYPTIIKPSTTYTVQLKQTTVNSEFPLTINLGGTVMAVPSTKFTITTPETLTSQDVIFTGKNNVIGEVVVTEGDTTGIEYDYFEGMNDVKSPSMYATGKNLFDGELVDGYIDTTTGIVNNWSSHFRTKNYIKIIPNTKYVLNKTTDFGENVLALFFYDINKNFINVNQVYYPYSSCTSPQNAEYVLISGAKNSMSLEKIKLLLQLEEGSTATSYEPYKGVTIEQSIDSIPLTSDMFEQGNINAGDATVINGMSYQQFPKLTTNSDRIKTKTIIPVKPNAKYTINFQGYAIVFDKNGDYVKIGSEPTLDFTSGVEFTIPSNAHYIALCLKYADDSTITPSTLDSLNLTLQEVTDEIVLRSIGDVKDTLNLTTGEYVQRIGEVVLDGSENWQLATPSSGEGMDYIYCMMGIGSKNNYAISNNLNNAIISHTETNVGFIITNPNSSSELIRLRFNTTDISVENTKNTLQASPLKIQFVLATPIIHKVNLTNTTKLPSYTSTTHYDTIVPSNSLVPNIKIPSTIDYNVAIKPSTEYTVRCNTTDALSVNLGGSEGTLANGKVTLTTPSTLAHNSLKLGNGKAKEVMVVEGSEIKDNVPFFNGMKNVQMGGIKLVNIARFKNVTALVTANANKTQFTYTGDGSGWGHIYFDTSLLKPNTKYTLYVEVIKDNGTDTSGSIKWEIGHNYGEYSHNIVNYIGIYKKAIISIDESLMLENRLALAFRPTTSGNQVVIQNPMIIEGDWTHLDEIPYIESEMIIEQPIIRSQGKNLFDVQQFYLGAKNINGVSLDGQTLIFDSKDNTRIASMAKDVFDNTVFKPNTQYTITFTQQEDDAESIFGLGFSFLHTDGTTVFHSLDYLGTQTITSAQGKTVEKLQLAWQTQAQERIAKLSNIQLEEGSTATSYEPYKHQTLYSNRVIGYEDGCYYAWDTGTKASAEAIASVMSDVEGLNVAYVTHASSNFSFYDKDGVYLSGSMFLSTATDSNSYNSNFDRFGFIKIPANAKYMKMACGNTNSGSAKDYHLKATVTGELPLRSLPNGVCDSFNLVTGEYVQRVREIVWNGNEDWMIHAEWSKGSILCLHKPIDGRKMQSYAVCDRFKTATFSQLSQNDIAIVEGLRYESGSSSLYIFISKHRLMSHDANGFKQYLSQNPITVQYELETPIVRKIGLTAKGNYKEVELIPNHYQSESVGIKCIRATTSGIATSYPEAVENSPIFTNDYNVRHYLIDTHGDYQYIVLIGTGVYINIPKNEVSELTTNGCRKWLEQNPIKIGILTKNSASLYSNIQKPIFFSDVKVQFMNNNVDIQPTLTLQSTSINSYVMDMMKPNTLYTLKALANPNSFTIDGTSYGAGTNDAFTSPSTLTNKLLITGQDVQELMIIEGDVTGKKLPYYKGILSSYHDVDEIEVYSVNKNLFDMNQVTTSSDVYKKWETNINPIKNEIISKRIANDNQGAFPTSIRINVKPATRYCLRWESDNAGMVYIYSTKLWDSANQLSTNYGSDGMASFVVPSNANYIEIGLNYGDSNGSKEYRKIYNIALYEVNELQTVKPPYIPHTHNTTLIEMPTRLETVEVVKIDMLKDMEIGAINHGTGANIDSSTVIRTKNYIPVHPNMQITYCNNGVERATHFIYYDINKNFIGGRIYESWMTSKGTITTPDNCYFIRLYHGVTNVDNLTITKQQYKPIALNSLPNGVKDELIINRATSSAKLIRRIGKVVLDGSEDWAINGTYSNGATVYMCQKYTDAKLSSISLISNILPTINIVGNNDTINDKHERFLTRITGTGKIQFISKTPFDSINQLKDWLKENPITVYYELETPVITEIRLKGYPFVYEDGSISLNTDIAPVTRTSYNVNQHQLINSQNETIIRHDKQISDLYDYIEIYLDEIYRMELFKMQLELSL